jgi:hypothetical protein
MFLELISKVLLFFGTGDLDTYLSLFLAKDEVIMLPVVLFILVNVLFWLGW